MHPKKVIVIGSGVSGMAAAIRLAIQGNEVAVYEKNSFAGGKLSAFEQDGYCFDAGPSLFTQPANLEELFALAKEPIGDYFSYQQVPVACHYFFSNGKAVKAYTQLDEFAEELQSQLGEDKALVKKYLQQSAKAYHRIGSIFLNFSLHKAATWFHRRLFNAITAIKWGYLFGSLNRYNQSSFRSPQTVQLFNRYATYNGSNPYKAPGMLSLIPHLEQNEGTFYPTGGMIAITHALYQLAIKKGVQFYFNTPVQRIINHAGQVKGVVVNDSNIMADLVVSNSDAYFTYLNLLQNTAKAKKILKQERSSSAVIFYWGMGKCFEELGLHNIFFSNNYVAEFDAIFNKKTIYPDPTIYLNITSKMEAGQAPAGCENWFVMVNAPCNTGQPWPALKQQLRAFVLDKLSRHFKTDIAALIQTEHTLDPVMIEAQTFSYSGSLYGTSSNTPWAAFLRHPNFSKSIRGLYFCGGSVHPGGGIPLCFKSAKIVSQLIASDVQKWRH
jgi:phytoene desaturase